MDIKYKFNELSPLGVLDTLFWHESNPADAYRIGIEVPIVNGKYLEGAALDSHVLRYAPVAGFMRKLEASVATNAEVIKSLVSVERSITVPQTEIDKIKTDRLLRI